MCRCALSPMQKHTAWRDGCSSSPGQGSATSSKKAVSSWSFASLLRVLIRGPISVQGQFDLHTHSTRNWREAVSSSCTADAVVTGGHHRARLNRSRGAGG